MENYLSINKKLWNEKTAYHLNSDFYQLEEFIKGKSSLIGPELKMLSDIKNKTLLHLQCHFGQDTLSLARLGAKATGLDFSESAIKEAKALNKSLDLDAEFVCCDLYSARKHISKLFDIVFTSYGTIGWLPDLDKWAEVICESMEDGAEFIMVDFHPQIWMYDSHFDKIIYSYFNREPIIEENKGTYADKKAPIQLKEIGWNHPLSDIIQSLINAGLTIKDFQEYDYSSYACFNNLVELSENKYQIKGKEGKIPMMYSLVAQKLN